ncbi:sensor histidine kinase [Bacillus alkalicellulosilyticus]|uniref:sensor histidine kinase n=1 Tax=Alkalihalobacterium alkalicellulosilyticum TaxID=1912214 RepID=UPI0009970B0D|nr:sensor histidine kinase [Bacillus alkalicellulosilyticus]
MADKQVLEQIITKTIDTVGASREEIFKIGEQSRHEFQMLEKELCEVRLKVNDLIEKSDQTDRQARLARNRLVEVSKNFDKFSNDEVRVAYEQANEFQVQLAILRHEEQQLRERRDSIERRIGALRETIERSDTLSGQMSVVYNFLAGDLRQFGEIVEDAKEKQKFGLKIIEAQEEERKRLSREIHDGPAQMMANLLLRSELIERIYNERGIQEALSEIKDLRKMVKLSLGEVRRIIYDLRPMALDDLGLVPTLSKYIKTFAEHTNMKLSFKNVGKEKRIPPQLEVALFRLVQEALQNAYKHANATEVEVKIEITDKKVIILVKDDGQGFDMKEKKEGSFGLIGMKERINMLKGEMKITSKLNVGTTIFIVVPLMND